MKIKSIKGLLFLLYSLLVVVTPLIFLFSTNELFELPKITFIYIVGTLIILLFLISCILYPTKIKLPSKYILFFILSFVISTIFSSHIQTSLWGYYTRFNDGLISTLIFFGLYFVAINIFEKKDFAQLLILSLLSVLSVSTYGILQHFGFFLVSDSVDRVYSTLGQPNWLAQYLSMFLPFLVFLIISSESCIFWLVQYLVIFTCFWFTYSMSGIVGFLVSIVVLMKFVPINKKTLTRLLIVGIISLVIVFFNFNYFKSRAHDLYIDTKSFITDLGKVYASEDIYLISDPGFIRKGLWQGSLDLALSSPKIFLIGVGPENFPYAFQDFRPKILNYSSEWDFILNKPHNYYLEILTEQGIIGLMSYWVLMYFAFKKSPKFMIPMLVSFFITNFFGWPVVITSLFFWLFLSYIEVNED